MGETEADVVVVLVVPVTVRRAQPVRFVVPGTAAQHTPGSVRSVPVGILSRKKSFSASPTHRLVWHGQSSFAPRGYAGSQALAWEPWKAKLQLRVTGS